MVTMVTIVTIATTVTVTTYPDTVVGIAQLGNQRVLGTSLYQL